MSRRLVELYGIGESVLISFDGQVWRKGSVVGLEHPGVWVALNDGSRWFVTNRRRIRPVGTA